MYLCGVFLNLFKTKNMRYIITKIGVLLFVITSFCGCDKVNMLNCKFERKSIDNFRFSEINLDKFNSFDNIGFVDVANITATLLKGTAPILFNLNVEGSNPNKSVASIEQMDWKVFVDDAEFIGSITEKFSIPAQGTNILPLEIGFNAINVLNGKTPQSMFRLYQNITGKNIGQESNVTIMIRPTIMGIKFPNYITLNQTIN
jgi:hypothetical protein